MPSLSPETALAPVPLPTLGLGADRRQFALLVAINAIVGEMVGLERSILPGLAEADFGVTFATVAVSFIAMVGSGGARFTPAP